MKAEALTVSVAASCRIAGIRTTDGEVRSVLGGDPGDLSATAEMVGYAAALDAPFPMTGPIVGADDLARLNAMIVGRTGSPPPPSPLREIPLHLEVFDQDGRAIGRVLQTLPPRLLHEKLEALVSWLEIELRSDEVHKLCVVGAAFVYLAAISPFERGNGRTARAVVRHLLRRSGYDFVDYASWEGVVDDSRAAYYEAIDAAETKLWTDEADLEPWLAFFLDSLLGVAGHLEQANGRALRERALPPLQRAILDTIRRHGSGGAALLIETTGANRNTLKDNLRRLVERGLLERHGTKRGTTYRLPGPPASAVEE